jgi:hypothetical protein
MTLLALRDRINGSGPQLLTMAVPLNFSRMTLLGLRDKTNGSGLQPLTMTAPLNL